MFSTDRNRSGYFLFNEQDTSFSKYVSIVLYSGDKITILVAFRIKFFFFYIYVLDSA